MAQLEHIEAIERRLCTAADQLTNLSFSFGSAGFATSGFSSPVVPEALAMPLDEGGWSQHVQA